MARVKHDVTVGYSPYGSGLPEAREAGDDLWGAAFRQENPVYSAVEMLSAPQFAPDPNFDLMKAGEEDELFLDHFKNLAAAKSQDEYDSIRARIVQEEKDRDTLAAGGWGGFAAAAVAGSLSPTILIPGVGAAKGALGVGQAFALAAAAATADELVLMQTQLTRTPGEVGFGIAAGTVLGGLLGSAAVFARPLERLRAEGDMARFKSQTAILTSDDGARMASRPDVITEEDFLRTLPEAEARALREDPAFRDSLADGSIGAKATQDAATAFYAPNKVAARMIEVLGRLNPVTRTVNQTWSNTARDAALQMADAGLKTVSDTNFRPHAPEGTVEARVAEYQAIEARFLTRLDDAFARHIEGDKLPADQLQNASVARAKAALTKPQGKLSDKEFNKEVFRVANTGEDHPDPNVVKAAKAWEDFSNEVKAYADEAYNYRASIDPEAKPLFDPEGNLGPDAHKWVSHVFDPVKIEANYEDFVNDLADHYSNIMRQQFQKEYQRFTLKKRKMDTDLGDMSASPAGRVRKMAELSEDIEEIKADAEFKEYNEGLAELLKQKKQFEEEEGAGLEEIRHEYYDQVADELLPDDDGQWLDALEELEVQIEEWKASKSSRVQELDKELRRLAQRRARLRKWDEMDPEKLAEQTTELRRTIARMEHDFEARWRERQAGDLDLEAGLADFAQAGRDAGNELAERIVGLDNPIAGLEILGAKRGPELARTLNLPLNVKSKYLELDMEKVARIYGRKIGPDIEMYRKFGSVNAGPVFEKVKEDFRLMRERIEQTNSRPVSNKQYRKWLQGEAVGDDVAMRTWTVEERKAAAEKMIGEEKQVLTDLRVMVQRLRHQRGIPSNPNGIMYRLGRAAMDMNVFRLMGNVVVSSLPDVARPVMRYGVSKVFRNGWAPLVSDLKRLKMTREEAKRIGVGLDPIMHNRAQAVFDMYDDYAGRQTRAERVTGFLANKTGFVAGFDRWTAEMKQIAAGVTIAEVSNALEQSAKAGKHSAFLAENGIDPGMAVRIMEQMELPEGSDLLDGVRLPNTESWTDIRAKRAYRAAINRMVNDLIVTPGLDRPNWVDENTAFRMVAQFRSFTFASTNRVMLQGAQQQDMALVQGMALSLALGALSYYTYAVSRGGDALKEANEFDPGKWTDEAISRSGLMGILAEGHNILQRIPGAADFVTFGGQATTRRPTSLMGAVAGPTFDLAERLSSVLQGLDEPTQSTLHQLRLMSAYQNVFYLRWLFDRIEDAGGSTLNLPERRN